ncbi:MAG TPA: TonB-dependent receptor [Blastocatellia bacterium]|nr:TonB-dependent receptor [Blastocatellia bacterium]
MANCFRNRNRIALLAAALLLCLLSAAGPARAQVLYGSVIGSVTDTAGSSVTGATVRLTNMGTNQTRETTSDENGNFIFTSVPGGAYSVNVRKEGFQMFTMGNVTVTPDSKIRVDASLRVGNVQEVLEITSSGAVIQTDSAEVRGEVTATSLQNLPVPIGRNYENLLVTIPGVAPPDNQHSIAANPSRGLTFSVNGSTRNSNAIRIDGSLATNLWLPHVSAYSPSLESVQAVSVVTGAADADQGLAGGSAVNVQVKSGTNQLHGSLFEYHADNALKAKPFFLPINQRKPKFINNQFGGSIGGRIKKDRLFYFASWEGTRDRQTGATIVTIPTAAILSGDMSASPNQIYDPLTGNPDGTGRVAFADKKIPQNRIDPIARKILELMPAPTSPNLLTNNLYAAAPFAVNRSKLDAKITWTPSSKMTVNGRLGWLKYSMSNPPALGELGGVPTNSTGGRAGLAFGNVYSTTYSLNYVFSPSFVVDTYVGWQLTKTSHDPVRLDEKLGTDFLGIPGTNGPELAGGWPRFSITNYTDIGTQGNSTAIRYNDWQYEIVGNASWTRKSHTIRFGIDMARVALNHYEATSGPGVFNFTGGATALNGGPSPNQFNSFAQFLLGMATSVAKEELPFDDNQLTSRQTTYSFYVKDGWQASRSLTVSAGLRWDYFPLGTRKSGGLGRYDFNTNVLSICGGGDVASDCGYRINQKNFSPRLGLAYRMSDSFVIRAGYGLNYDPYPLAFVRNLLSNYPNDLLLTVNPANNFQTVATFKTGIPAVVTPDISSGRITVPAVYQVRSLDDRYERGYIQSWNLSLQKEFWGGFIAQAAYIGTRQLKISQTLDLNAGQILGAGRNGQPFFAKFGRTVQTALLTPVGRNQYDSLQTKLQRRFSNGIEMNVAYTFSKAIGICCDELSDSLPAIQIPQFMGLARALEPFDRPHNFNTTVVAGLPFGRGKRWAKDGVLAHLAGGWSVNGLLTAYSGRPFSVSASDASLNAPGNVQRANQVKPKVEILGGIGSASPYFDPLAFAPVTTATFGTAGYNTLRGPSAINLDLGLFRAFNVTERWKVEFRAEALNFTNTPHFALPNGNVSNLQLNADGTIRSLGGFATITGVTGVGREGVDERIVRFGLRISF